VIVVVVVIVMVVVVVVVMVGKLFRFPPWVFRLHYTRFTSLKVSSFQLQCSSQKVHHSKHTKVP
jgi:hypothetical protein